MTKTFPDTRYVPKNQKQDSNHLPVLFYLYWTSLKVKLSYWLTDMTPPSRSYCRRQNIIGVSLSRNINCFSIKCIFQSLFHSKDKITTPLNGFKQRTLYSQTINTWVKRYDRNNVRLQQGQKLREYHLGVILSRLLCKVVESSRNFVEHIPSLKIPVWTHNKLEILETTISST